MTNPETRIEIVFSLLKLYSLVSCFTRNVAPVQELHFQSLTPC